MIRAVSPCSGRCACGTIGRIETGVRRPIRTKTRAPRLADVAASRRPSAARPAREVLRQPRDRVQPRGRRQPPTSPPEADRRVSHQRGREVIAHGTGWVERIVVDHPEISTYFTPLSICLNVDSFEHLEFETRPDQLLVYTLVQGDESVRLEFAPTGMDGSEPNAPRQLEFDTSGYVQMELPGGDAPAQE